MPNDNKLYGENYIANACRAIRVKNGLSTEYRAMDMEAAILAIPTGSGETNYLPAVCNDAAGGYSLPAGALDGVTSIRPYTFYESHVTSVAFPSGLTAIGEHAFTDSDITGVDLPASVTSIGKAAFKGTAGRTFIIRATTPPTIVNDSFGGLPDANLAIYVPDASLSAYQSAWGYYYQVIHPISDL